MGYVSGRIASHASSSIPILEPLTRSAANDDSLQVARIAENGEELGSHRAQVELPHSTMIGDLKLATLKARLGAVGVPAEFAGEGVLVCGDIAGGSHVVAVRKMGRGNVVIEGGACEIYYTVRKEVYALYAIVAT